MKTMRPLSIFLLAASLALPAQAQDFRELPVNPDQDQEQKPLTKEQLFQLAQGRLIDEIQAADPGDLQMMQRLIQESGRNEMLLGMEHRHDPVDGGPWVIGVVVEPIEPILREHFGIDEGTGARVSFVAEDKPAAKAGIKVNDIVVSADGQKVSNLEQLRDVVTKCGKEGRPLSLEIIHKGKRQPVSIEVDGPKPGDASERPLLHHPETPRVLDPRLPELLHQMARHEQQIRELQKEIRQLRKQVKEQAKDEDRDQE